MTRVPRPSVRLDPEGAADRLDPVAHVRQSGAERRVRRIEPRSVIGDLEHESVFLVSQSLIVARAPSPACFAAFWSASRQQK